MRQPLRLIAAVLFIVAAGCSNDAKVAHESDLLPEANLVFPGAVVRSRSFSEAEKGTYIDGDDFDHPNRLSVTFDLEQPVLGQDILDWYSEALIEAEWTAGDQQETSSLFRNTAGGWKHSYRVSVISPADAVTDVYQVFYVLIDGPA